MAGVGGQSAEDVYPQLEQGRVAAGFGAEPVDQLRDVDTLGDAVEVSLELGEGFQDLSLGDHVQVPALGQWRV